MFSTFATGSAGNMSWTIIYIVAIAAMFYFMLIRPSKKQNKSRAEMLNALCVGDEIYTTGGILGTVTRIKEKTIQCKKRWMGRSR